MIDPPSPGKPWIALRDVGFSHGDRPVLAAVTLSFHPGRHYVVAGPNGAGKSTLLDVIAGLRRPVSGDIDLFDRPAAGRARHDMARILSLAPQEYRLDFPFTVREVAAMGRRPHLGRWGRMSPEDHAAVDRALADVRMDALALRPVTALSGGERRRCVLARALAQSTPILLLDEPSAGLDIAQALAVMALARRLARAGALVITVSHDLNLAAAFGDEIVFLKDGRVAAHGPAAETITADTLFSVYGTEATVRRDDFAGGMSVSFRLADAGAEDSPGFP